MTQIDFIISIGIIVGAISLIFLYLSTNVSNQIDFSSTNRLTSAASSLGYQIEDKLTEKFNQIQSIFSENGGYSHTETIRLTIRPSGLQKIHVYDEFWDEIPSTKTEKPNEVDVEFDLSFSANEKKYVSIVYFGPPTTDIEFNPAKDISAVILSEKTISVVSQNKCSEFRSKSYDESKSILSSDSNFRINITDCEFGLNPPNTTVVVLSKPFFIEKSNQLVSPDFSKIIVW